MASIKQALSYGLVCCVALLLTSCSTPHRPSPTADSSRAEPVDEASFQPLPDPYQAQRQPLPQGAESRFEQARRAMHAEDWQKAQAVLEQMTKNWPQLSGPWVNLGLVYRQQKRDDRAENAFRNAIAANRLNSEAYNQLAILYREQGRFAEAEKFYRQALEVWPHNPIVHRNLGILYELYMGRFSDALHHYQMSQKVAAKPEQQVEGWILDLQRRLKEQQAALQ